jgi:hypothetical protein
MWDTERALKGKPPSRLAGVTGARKTGSERAYTLKELPHPQVVLTLGFSNLNPAPSKVST